MAFIHSSEVVWHEGEQQMHSILRVPDQENPTSPFLTPGAAAMLQRSPLLAIGMLDSSGNPWTTIWGGEAGFARSLGSSIIGVKTLVDRLYDPVIETLAGDREDEEIIREEGQGRIVSGLCIDLATRSRVKLAGRIIAGALGAIGPEKHGEAPTGQVQLAIKVERSLGNCPKYLNKKQIIPSIPKPILVSSTPTLPPLALSLISKSNLFFISTSHNASNMGTNNRGGVPGFVRIISNSSPGTILAFPEYSGNRLYQTLGNLHTNPKAGLVFPDFESQDVLYVTGVTKILIGKEASALLPRSNLVVKLYITSARFIQHGLPFRGIYGEPSPYNPTLRYLSTEKSSIPQFPTTQNQAHLLSRTLLTPTIARFRFRTSTPNVVGTWTPGQYVALGFEDEVGMGYSHMRDDDPRSLNDDFVRTFTVSSAPESERMPSGEFEITIRNVGVVTNWLFRCNIRAGIEIPVKGFGGAFHIDSSKTAGFIAGGIGITPLLACLDSGTEVSVTLFWSVNARDIDLVVDTFTRYPTFIPRTKVFVSGVDECIRPEDINRLEKLEKEGVRVMRRRMMRRDVSEEAPGQRDGEGLNGRGRTGKVKKWYIFAGKAFRENVMEWVEGDVVWEDFGY